MEEFRSLGPLVDRLFGGLLGDKPWEDFLLALRAELNSDFGTLILMPPDAKSPGQVITPGAPAHCVTEYSTDFFYSDPFTSLPEGQAITIDEFVISKWGAKSPYYTWLSQRPVRFILGLDLKLPDGFQARLRMSRGPTKSNYTSRDKALCNQLVPHLRHAVALYDRLETSRIEHRVYSDAIDQLAIATIIIDHEGRIVRHNATAAQILAEGGALQVTGGRIALDPRNRNDELRQILKLVRWGKQHQVGFPKIIPIERDTGDELRLIVQPIGTPGYMPSPNMPALVLFIRDPARHTRIHARSLRDMFGLTPMEANIAASFANGLSLEQTALSLGIARNTVRTHLRSVFTKTGVSRQSQLVHRLYASLPELATGHAPPSSESLAAE